MGKGTSLGYLPLLQKFSASLECKKVLLSFLGLESSISPNKIFFFRVACFIFQAQNVPSWNFLILKLESSIWKIRNFFGIDFAYIFEPGLESAPGKPIIHYSLLIRLGIYCCFTRYQAKQGSLLPYHYTMSILKEKGY